MEIVESLSRRYIRRKISDRENGNTGGYPVGMLLGNKIPGLVCVDKRCIDGAVYLYYDITGLENMCDLQYGINGTLMTGIVQDMDNLLQNLEMYLLKQYGVCLSPDCIWCDIEMGRWKFIYNPEDEGKQREEVERLLEFIMDHIDCEDENELERFYNFYSDVLQCTELPGIREIIRFWKKGEEKVDLHQQTEETPIIPAEVKEEFYIGKSISAPEIGDGFRSKERIYSVPFRGIKVAW